MNSLKSPRLAAMLAALLLAGATGGAIAAAKGKKPAGLERYGVAVYSDLCLQKDSGEIGGQRVTLHRFAEADSVIYEFTAGALSWPIVANDVNLDAATGAFDFTIAGADNEERTIGWCDTCRGRHCPECERCACSRQIASPRCPGCGLTAPARDGAEYCRTCEADGLG